MAPTARGGQGIAGRPKRIVLGGGNDAAAQARRSAWPWASSVDHKWLTLSFQAKGYFPFCDKWA